MKTDLLKRLGISCVVLALSACTSSVNNGRSIELTHSVPVSSTTFSTDVKLMVKERENSYVTLSITRSAPPKSGTTTTQTAQEITTGSGFIIDTKGHVVTAAHVGLRKGALVTAIGPQGKRFSGKVVALQRIGDMALIKLNAPETLVPVRPVKNPCLAPGAAVLSLGKPGVHRDVARVGVVSKLYFKKKVRYQKYGYDEAMVLQLQTRRGESGGPVFDSSGALVGMIVSTLSSAAGHYLDLAHALPTPNLGKFICSKTRCSKAWRKVSRKRISSCPIAPTAHQRLAARTN